MTLSTLSRVFPLLLAGLPLPLSRRNDHTRVAVSPITVLRRTAGHTPRSWLVSPAGVGRRPRSSGDTTVAAQLATITTDTGAFAPGHHQFASYDTPGLCWAAAASARKVTERSVRHLAEHLFPGFDTTGLSTAAAIARACGARFTLANTPRAQLGDLFKLALYEQNDTLAEAALAQRLADRTTPNPTDAYGTMADAPADLEFANVKVDLLSGDVREGAFLQLLAFGRFATAQRFLTQVDQAVPDKEFIRLAMHMQYAYVLGNYQTDTARMLHEDSVVIRLGLANKKPFTAYHAVLNAYRDFVNLALYGDSAGLLVLEHRAKHDLATFTAEEQKWNPTDAVVDWRASAWTAEEEKVLVPEWYRFVQGVDGRPAPRVQADFWFSAPGRPAADTLIPVPGKYNLICGGGNATDNLLEANGINYPNNETYLAFVQAVHLKRWLAEYGNAGLVATVIRAAIGAPWVEGDFKQSHDVYVRDSAAEAGFWHWYDQEYHQLPVTEGVVVLHTTERFPPPDNRRTRVVQTLDTAYFNLLEQLDGPGQTPETGACTLVDPNGRILYQRNKATMATWLVAYNNGGTWSDVLKWVFTRHVAGLTAHAQH